jgi:hypothetical protein
LALLLLLEVQTYAFTAVLSPFNNNVITDDGAIFRDIRTGMLFGGNSQYEKPFANHQFSAGNSVFLVVSEGKLIAFNSLKNS